MEKDQDLVTELAGFGSAFTLDPQSVSVSPLQKQVVQIKLLLAITRCQGTAFNLIRQPEFRQFKLNLQFCVILGPPILSYGSFSLTHIQ